MLVKSSWLTIPKNEVLQCSYSNNDNNAINTIVSLAVYQPVHVFSCLSCSIIRSKQSKDEEDIIPAICWWRTVEWTEWNCFLCFTNEICGKPRDWTCILFWNPIGIDPYSTLPDTLRHYLGSWPHIVPALPVLG